MDRVKVRKLSSLALRFNSPRKTYNFLHATYEGRTHKIVVKSHPVRAQMDPSSVCNLRCPECYYGQRHPEKRRSGMMKFEDFKAYFDPVAPYLLSIALYNWGESFLNDDFPRMAEYANSRNVCTVVHSNMNILTPAKAEAAVKSGLFHIYLSIDGACQETYQKYRIGGDFERVIDNIRLMVETKRRLRSATPILTWKLLTFPHVPPEEVGQARRMAMEIGCDNFLVSLPNPVSTGRHPLPEGSLKRPKLCRYLYGELYVDWDGSVMPCCLAFRDSEVFGNLRDSDWQTVWNNERFREARAMFANPFAELPAGSLPCTECPILLNWREWNRRMRQT